MIDLSNAKLLPTRIVKKLREFEDEMRWRIWQRREAAAREKLRQDLDISLSRLPRRPLISILLPVYNIEERWLRRCIDSVLGQWYPDWQLCIADDCSPGDHVRRVLSEYAAQDTRIEVVYRGENGHISAASNSALSLAHGEYTALLDHDDELSEDALFWVASEICDRPNVDLIYSDEDKIDESGQRFYPSFKPDWSRDLLYSLNFLTHLSVYRTAILRSIGGFRLGFEGSQDYDLALRFIEKIPEKNISHVPRILYHWRAIRGSVALGGDEKSYAHDRARSAINEHFDRTGTPAMAEESVYQLHRARYRLPQPEPQVGVFVHGEEHDLVADSLRRLEIKNYYANAQFIGVAGGVEGLAKRLDSAASQANFEVFVFVAAGFEPTTGDWMTELVRFAVQPMIGAAGPKLLRSDNGVLLTGLIVGAGGVVGAAHFGRPKDAGGNLGRSIVIGNYSAVSILCMATRRPVFESVGGFDHENLPGHFFDADYCLRLGESDLRVVGTPHAELASRADWHLQYLRGGSAAEAAYMAGRWAGPMERDPCYNPNLSKKDAGFRLKI